MPPQQPKLTPTQEKGRYGGLLIITARNSKKEKKRETKLSKENEKK